MKENIGKLTTPSGEGASISIENNNISLDGKISGSGFNLVDITNVDLDTITSFGNYISHRYSKALNYPYYITDEEIEEDCILKVNTDTSNKTIIQELEIGKYSTFRRVYKDNNWNGWIQTSGISINETTMEDVEPYTCLYVTKDGNDSNDGFTWDTALLSIEEAIKRVHLYNTNSTKGCSRIYIGAGDYDELILDNIYGLIEFVGYTDDFTQEFPFFPQIVVRDTNVVTIRNLHTDNLDVSYNSFVRTYGIKIHHFNVRLYGKLVIANDVWLMDAKARNPSSTSIQVYKNSSLFFNETITITIPKEIVYDEAFVTLYENSTISFMNISKFSFINPENLTTDTCLKVFEGGRLVFPNNGNMANNSKYFPINYTKYLDCYNDGWYGNGTMTIHQPVSVSRSSTSSNGFIHSYVDVDENDGTTTATRYSGWYIWSNTNDRSMDNAQKALAFYSYRRYTNMTSSIGLYINKNLGSNSGQTALKVGWTLKNNEIVPFANCPAFKGDGTISNILTIADAPVYIVEMSGDSDAWYKKYNNGFIEQGGYVKGTSTSTNIVVTFSTAFTSTKYFIKKNRPVESSTSLTYKGENFYNLTNTSATTWVGTEMLEFTWYACGY